MNTVRACYQDANLYDKMTGKVSNILTFPAHMLHILLACKMMSMTRFLHKQHGDVSIYCMFRLPVIDLYSQS